MASIREIAIDTGALNRDVGTLNGTLDRIYSELSGMSDAIQTLDGMWDGPANEMFVQQFRHDYESMQEVCKGVRSLIQSMEDASKKYAAGENQVSGIVAAIRI